MAFDPTKIKIGPGTLYAAPLGTAEPVAVTGMWPTGWVPLGYTDQGSTFSFGPTVAGIAVEEEFWDIDEAITAYAGDITFVLAETTRQNLALALNAGIGASVDAASQGVNGDGSIWQEPPAAGSESRVMIGWDAISQAGTSANDPFGRLIIRKCIQTGKVTRMARKGNNKSMYACQFALIKPLGAQPFRMIFESGDAT